ncbi:flagellar hook protein FlgE [Kushneria aurantia]|uniref:Flagellar hook protein FlgE n=1 Tax=Kushneria aurantia TaxID=504092 RepID=A0ABV6G0Y9_9GAMM|nr:flagellar hook protein FlgE [Kushneria aurantia]
MAFTQGISGLNAASRQLDTIGNNIANSQTVGFKSARTEFADIYAGSKGLGVQVSGITQGFSTGALENTGRDLDLAIDGGGFFRLNDGQQITYSRNGQFQVDEQGFMVNGNGARLTGYPVNDPNGANPQVLDGADPVALQIPQADLQANATSQASMELNLNSSAETLGAGDIDPADSESYNFTRPITTYDSLGNPQQVNLYFRKVSSVEDGPSNWSFAAFSNGNQVGESNLVFDSNGQLTDGGEQAISIGLNNGAESPLNFNLDLAATQFSGESAVRSASQDGYQAGSFTSLSIAENGNLIGNYSNEQSRVLGRVALAEFANEQGLQPMGNNAWTATQSSGQELLGTAGSGQLGSLRSGTVEASNVDLAGELVSMIVAQRNYQANAQTIKTQDQILQTVVTLR